MLIYMKDNDVKLSSSDISILIKLNFFEEFGNQKALLDIAQLTISSESKIAYKSGSVGKAIEKYDKLKIELDNMDYNNINNILDFIVYIKDNKIKLSATDIKFLHKIGILDFGINELEVSERNSMNDFGMELRSIGIELKKELWPPRLITMWMFIAGFVSGFLGGLISVRGPPLIVFFFFYDYPKVQIKANGTVIAAVNTLVRIITYIVKPTPAEYGHDSWFVGEEVWLYVVVAVVGILASPIGIYLSRYLNKWTYKAGLAVLLVINGITMITTSIIKLFG